MAKQYVILDNSAFSTETLHAILAHAELCKQSGTADIKLVVPRMLFAEYQHSIRFLWDCRKKEAHVNGKPELLTRQKSDRPKLMDFMKTYADYIIIPEPSAIETKVKDLMIAYLAGIYRDNPDHFHFILYDRNESISNPEQELPDYLSDGRRFAKVYSNCKKEAAFNEILRSNSCKKNLADKAIVEWYSQNIVPLGTDDVLLVSDDNKLIEKMTAIYENTCLDENHKHLAHLDFFTHEGIAAHMKADLEDMKTTLPEASSKTAIEAVITLCKAVMDTKKPSFDVSNDSRFTITR
jgi:hypothetical protein